MFSGFFPAGFAAFRRFLCCAGRRRFPFGAKKTLPARAAPFHRCRCAAQTRKTARRRLVAFVDDGSGDFPFLRLFFACYRRLGTFEAVNAQ